MTAGEEVPITEDVVSCLLREQFPQWAGERVRPVELSGWDNRTFRIGEQLTARLPSAAGYVPAVAKEHQWLPVLRPHLPVPVPEPIALGRPGCGFLRPWSVYRWLPGETATSERVRDRVEFARSVAGFLTALQAVDAAGGPQPGPENGWRGGSLAVYDDETRRTARELGDVLDVGRVLEIWDAAIAAPHTGVPRWVHGDMTPSNLLVDGGRLCAVLDFGSCAVGDPACDLVLAWTFFDGPSRAAFRESIDVEPAAWTRARGWALWKALLTVGEGADAAATVRRYGWRGSALEVVRELASEAPG